MSTSLGEKEKSFSEAYSEFYGPVVGFFMVRGFGHEDAAELAQDTFLQVFRNWDQFRHDSGLFTWILGIAKNIYLRKIRTSTADKRSAQVISLDFNVSETQVTESLESPQIDPLEAALNNEKLDRLADAIQQLPPSMREIVGLWAKGFSYKEISVFKGISIETVRSHLFQGRKMLAARNLD